MFAGDALRKTWLHGICCDRTHHVLHSRFVCTAMGDQFEDLEAEDKRHANPVLELDNSTPSRSFAIDLFCELDFLIPRIS